MYIPPPPPTFCTFSFHLPDIIYVKHVPRPSLFLNNTLMTALCYQVPSRSEEGRVEKLPSIGQSNDKNVMDLTESIHQCEQLVHKGVIRHPCS